MFLLIMNEFEIPRRPSGQRKITGNIFVDKGIYNTTYCLAYDVDKI